MSDLALQPHTVCPYCSAPVLADSYGWRCSNGHGTAEAARLVRDCPHCRDWGKYERHEDHARPRKGKARE